MHLRLSPVYLNDILIFICEISNDSKVFTDFCLFAVTLVYLFSEFSLFTTLYFHCNMQTPFVHCVHIIA